MIFGIFFEEFRVSGFWIPVTGRAFLNFWFWKDEATKRAAESHRSSLADKKAAAESTHEERKAAHNEQERRLAYQQQQKGSKAAYDLRRQIMEAFLDRKLVVEFPGVGTNLTEISGN